MVWQDGERYITRNVEELSPVPEPLPVAGSTDNLITRQEDPVIIMCSSAGAVDGKTCVRCSIDTVSDKYGQFLLEELLPEVYAKYNIRKDAYSRAIQGQSRAHRRVQRGGGTTPISSAACTRSSRASSRSCSGGRSK